MAYLTASWYDAQYTCGTLEIYVGIYLVRILVHQIFYQTIQLSSVLKHDQVTVTGVLQPIIHLDNIYTRVTIYI